MQLHFTTRVNKKYKSAAIFSIFAILGIALFIAAWPAFFDHWQHGLGDQNGTLVMNNMLDIKTYVGSIVTYIYVFLDKCLPISLLCAATLVLLILNIKKAVPAYRNCDEQLRVTLLVFLPVLFSTIIIAIISTYKTLRYIMLVIPFVPLYALFLVKVCGRILAQKHPGFLMRLAKKSWISLAASCAILIISFALSIIQQPNYVYSERRSYDKIIEQYAAAPCICVVKDRRPAFTEDILQLIKFEDVFVTDDPTAYEINDYLQKNGNPNEVVLYVANRFLPDNLTKEGILRTILEQTGYDNYRFLFSSGFTDTYLLKKDVSDELGG